MGQRSYESTSVLVVGGGLVGLSTAMFLAWRGVPCVLAEKRAGSSAHPRAIGYTTRTIELLSSIGIELPQHDGGGPRRARVESLAGQWFEEYPWSPGGASHPKIEYSPYHGTAVPQDQLEPILRDKAVELGADVRLDTELVDLVHANDDVTATLRHRDGRETCLRAEYLVAADGVHSPLREKLGIGRSGQGLLAVQRSILFRAPLDEYLEHGIVQFEIDQPGLSAFLTTYMDGRWVLMLSDDVERDDDELRAVIRQAVGRSDLEIELITSGRWELAALIADQFRVGRVFLAGDAAHQLPPNRGGYGANTGIEDAHNLAWKLEAVLSGRSTADLLDTYDAERRPIAWLRHEQIFARADYKARLQTAVADVPIIDDDAMELGQLYRSAAVLDAGPELPRALRPEQWAGQPGTRAPHLKVLIGDTEGSTLHVFQRGWVLLSEDRRWHGAASRAGAELGVDLSFVHVGSDVKPIEPSAFQTAYGITTDGATLVRPDGYVAWRSVTHPTDATAALTDALRRVSSASAQTLAQRVQRLEDVEAIRAVTARYATAVNKGWNGKAVDLDAISSIFATDARWTSRHLGIATEGLDAILAGLPEHTAAVQFSMHAFLNPVITVDTDTATGSWVMWVASIIGNDPRAVYTSADMAYTRTAEGWRIHDVDIHQGMLLNTISACSPDVSAGEHTEIARGGTVSRP
jgi:2-polyprenyl-6-methoxyphenol hydroxylase-like FAD-dependent oxidoreductase